MIAIIDYGAGNLGSVEKAFAYIGYPAKIAVHPRDIAGAGAIVLPGVGAFGDAMAALTRGGWPDAIREHVDAGRPFFGICLGMQLLFEGSEESPGIRGLSILPGTVRRFPPGMGLKIPHIGFNSITPRPRSRLFAGLPAEPYYYFVHTYHCTAEDPTCVAARADYGVPFDAAVERGALFATQFHPEKSGATGLKTLRNFVYLLDKH